MKPEISIVIPCLNESETLAKVINNALIGGRKTGKEFEIILADNGSTDGSIDIASQLGIKIVEIKTKGYGAAINGGVHAAIGDVILVADADDSYELENLDKFTNKIESGFDLVIGNRFQGGIQKGAMPFLHKYLGNPVLSLIGRILFKITIHDFHCGMRAFRKSKYEQIQILSSGMEFATEIIARFAQANFAIAEIPTILRKDGRSRKPHLRTWRDGWRHLRFILVNSPSWLFYFPGLFLTLIGVSFNVINIFGTIQIFGRKVETVGTVIACLITIVGVQFLWFEIIMKKASNIIGLGAKKSLPSK
jgi:glycosyltransferase involved in cell wall biosynthesis